MDIVTQAMLGATVGQAGFAHRLGRRANWYGAVAGILPDLDVIARPLGDEWQSLVWHRGITHSIWFGPVFGALIGYGVWRFYERKGRVRGGSSQTHNNLAAWIGLFTLGLLTHPFLDVFTTYGTQLLAPFSLERFSVYGVGVIDPFYTVWLAAALMVGWRSRSLPRRARGVASAALICSTLYLMYGVHQNQVARDAAFLQLKTEQIKTDSIHVYPTLFQPWLRRIVVWSGSDVMVGFHSNLAPKKIHWTSLPHRRSDPKVKALIQSERGQLFHWFANGQLVASPPSKTQDLVRVMDFRYGLVGDEKQGMWAIEGSVMGPNNSVESVRRVRNRPKDVRRSLTAMWQALRGLD
ncbi:MAG: metal-dependent hydrolase [Myxococcota bacterium]|nr:metal-dependent hydrolase [Myxococcota bacterium]